jgi:hypothetical protein
VYGGIGSGGSCGGHKCGAVHTVLGQIYRFDVTSDTWSPGRLDTTSHPSTAPAVDIVSDSEWQFAKISSDHSGDTGGTGKFTKRIALERVAYSEDRGILFEFGGVEFVFRNSSNGTNSSNDFSNGTGGSESVSSTASADSDSDGAGGLKWGGGLDTVVGERSGQGSAYYEAGGVLANDPWDLYTGEHLRETMDIPINSQFWYNSDPSASNSSYVSFQRIFRQYTIDAYEVILLDTDEINE